MTLLELLLYLATVLGAVGLVLGALVGLSRYLQRRHEASAAQGAEALDCFKAGWEMLVDGLPAAHLKWAGQPLDLNHYFVLYEVSATPGREELVEELLYRAKEREPLDSRVCYRCLAPGNDIVKDSQALISPPGRQAD